MKTPSRRNRVKPWSWELHNGPIPDGRPKGVFWDPARQKFRSVVYANGKRYELGRFSTEQEAMIAYSEAAKRVKGVA